MDKNYNFSIIEKKIQKFCKNNQNSCNHDNKNKIKNNNFCIMVPPPNITGYLHMGHAFQQTIMDVLIRYYRMSGKNTLLQMGTDHAGIATQMIVERHLLKKEGKNKNLYSRKEFIDKIFDWKKKSESIMFNQIKRLGHLINWDKVRFTLDSDFSIAVRKVFIMLYKDGLIYRKKKLVYWDPKLQTVVSDLEVENRIGNNTMWYIEYLLTYDCNRVKFINKKKIVVATTRPETLLGDTALAVHPDDIRYKKYIGCFVIVPIINRIIPIISDVSIDISKGTGCMKVTPAHDFNDYDIGQRNKLPMINIFTKNAKILNKLNIFDHAGKKTKIFHSFVPEDLRSLDRFVVRKKILLILKTIGLLKKSIVCTNSVPYGDRSGVILEPKLTNQWYLSTKSLSSVAINAVKEKKIVFVPKQYTNMFLSWMNNIQDWCISRQLWWGHQIPVWYDLQDNIYVGENEKSIRQEYSLNKDIILNQDPDVLDTWFSSSLWTFAGLGWPINKKKISMFHPTDILVCGFDIIFFWIARMIMITMHIIKDKHGNSQIPFKTVYVTGLIRDEDGLKMSKSHGNVLDPLDMIDGISLIELIKKRTKNLINNKTSKIVKINTIKNFPNGISTHSVDAVRYTFISLATMSRNINWNMNRLKGYQNFCNKIWHASRFVIKNVKNNIYRKKNIPTLLLDQWIYIKFNNVIKKYHNFIKLFRFDLLSVLLYKFIWNTFCDQYLEMIKPILQFGLDYEKKEIKNTLLNILGSLLLIIHPIMPFITTYIWNILCKLNAEFNSNIFLNSFPQYNIAFCNRYIIEFMSWFKKIISILRCIRVDTRVRHTKLLTVYLKNISFTQRIFLHENNFLLKKIAYLNGLIEIADLDNRSSYIMRVIDNVEIFILIDSQFNINIELNRINRKIISINKKIQEIRFLLLNKNFLNKAPSCFISEKKLLLINLKNSLKKIISQKKDYLKYY
ncbi:Valine--tRNA ligase [Buchnera aphidicola (Cinara kochiana kochiana)]|uniref:Valine--tRNA ligase n=1 Tax=Buchnera aphidicola (Cinara kochiana kochiana) TaxID=2518976 RepID=A0A451D5Q9_9GAMM|nr:valine--tRNA ligase [Buchnera aphidicola]VFP81142.1 Valine--tRNA ligase [Buchnera aphidicola (Cinara kochiana kochiana)]